MTTYSHAIRACVSLRKSFYVTELVYWSLGSYDVRDGIKFLVELQGFYFSISIVCLGGCGSSKIPMRIWLMIE